MARLGFIGPLTQLDRNGTGTLPRISRNNVNHNNYGFPIRSLAANGPVSSNRFGETDTTVSNQVTVYWRLKFRVRRLPSANKSFFFTNNSGQAGPGLVAWMSTTGTILFYNLGNQVSPGTLFATSAAVTVGSAITNWNDLKIKITMSVGSNNTGTVEILLNDVSVHNGAVGGANEGINLVQFIQSFSFSDIPADPTNRGMDMDLCNISYDDASFPTETQFTLIPVSGPGNYSNWLGGSPDYRYRNQMYNAATVNEVSTTLLSTRQSYALPTFASMGITGTIVGAQVVGQPGLGVNAQTGFFFVRRNGVDTDGATWTWSSASRPFHTTRFSVAAWSNTDVIEIGFISGAGAGTYIWRGGLWLLVEHTTPFVAPTSDTFAISRINWTGTAALQSITLPFEPDFIMFWPRTGTNNGYWWWRDLWGFKNLISVQSTVLNTLQVRGAFLDLLNNSVEFNALGTVYDCIVMKDPQNRVFTHDSWFQVDQTVPYDTDEYPVPSNLEPTAVMSTIETESTTFSAGYLFGPNQASDNSIAMQALAYVTNRVRGLTATGWTARRGMMAAASNPIQLTFWAVKPSNFATTKLSAITTYTGDGTASKVVTLDIGGATPVWVMVFPHNNGSRVIRNNQMSDSRVMDTNGASAVGITALGVDSITVGTLINVNLIVYTVMAFVEGEDAPETDNQYSGIYILDPTARHDTLYDREGSSATIDVKIPNPTYRTHFMGDG